MEVRPDGVLRLRAGHQERRQQRRLNVLGAAEGDGDVPLAELRQEVRGARQTLTLSKKLSWNGDVSKYEADGSPRFEYFEFLRACRLAAT